MSNPKSVKPAKPATPTYNDLSSEYWQLFLTCTVDEKRLPEVTALVSKISSNKSRYLTVASSLSSTPWWYVAVTHAMEAGLKFNTHLHNGDPLTARTTHVPAGQPKANPAANSKEGPSAKNPYTWEESAIDALKGKNIDKVGNWSIRTALYKLEGYNGWGYRKYHPTVLSPYLWSYTNHYTAGKYAADGKWSATLVSRQPGAAAILRVMIDRHMFMPIDYIGDFPTPSKDVMYA